VQENARLYLERFKRYTNMRRLDRGRGRVGRLVRQPGGLPRIYWRKEWNGKGDPGFLCRDLGSTLFSRGPEFLVTPLLMGVVCLIIQGRFLEPVRPFGRVIHLHPRCLRTSSKLHIPPAG